ncbi:Glycosyltransferase, catalytic subunit of cellulose synthase and poly-beta-1,6-N-acetylglucosamine synthase [Natronoarchaeum philippinense]|uniref:Glycosyltransferase, catalytic subunit of cellulose synthase and poly-beta-1,6-N-acetylglucosamine synthase n=1 Tax=Natronoarchaeum philippinense TaxID=558529 RepID=A0A285NBY2_NATPI|nr:glycosyltransferase [Natronoarchaeum philippinense]SNZ06788.1 Glycosyltransferase, catalytic subunit of cellulose synthase and poly-beta-1,6-N-acetylglucosamine synthase [Natronoarchaeum philippinense]
MNLFVAVAAALVAVTALPYLAFLALYAWVRPSGSPAEKREAEPTVSIVLPTYNESGIVEQKLDDICALEYPMEKIELVVVDSSDDETPELIEEYFADREFPELNLIRETERRGLAPALNDAYAAASNEMVVKTDCDSYVGEDALREAAANLADPDIGAVTGRNAEVLGGSEVEAGYRGVQAHIQTLESHLDSTLIFHGPFSAFENDAIQPIDPNSLADDTELALKIRRAGDRVVFDPAIRYMEASHSQFGKRRLQKDRRGMGLIRLLAQHRDAVGRYGNYGRLVLPFNWWFMIVSPWLVALGVLAVSAAAISVAGPAGLAVPAALLTFVWLGQKDLLGPLQAIYAVFDAQVSLLRAGVELLRGEGDGTWEVDEELREAFE